MSNNFLGIVVLIFFAIIVIILLLNIDKAKPATIRPKIRNKNKINIQNSLIDTLFWLPTMFDYGENKTAKPQIEQDEPVPLLTVMGEGQIVGNGETSIPQVTPNEKYEEPTSAPAPTKIGSKIEYGEKEELM